MRSVLGTLFMLVLLNRSLQSDVEITSDRPNQYVIVGDATLNKEELETITAVHEAHRQKRVAYKYPDTWTENTMLYEFGESLDKEQREVIKKAMAYISAHTCINFREDPYAKARVLFNVEGESLSDIGMLGVLQNISLPASFYEARVMHEIFHALGMAHMHTRPDRNKYIRVDYSAVTLNSIYYRENFPDQVIIYTPYDYGSIMHYDPSFTSEGQAITTLDERYQWTIGSMIPSFYDIMMLNKHYHCEAQCQYAKKIACANGGVPNPRNCDVCLCPRGYGGRFCDERPAGCGRTLRASHHWKTVKYTFDDTTVDGAEEYKMCNHWIKAPHGGRIQIRVTSLPNENCDFKCFVYAIEPKIMTDKRITSPRICCEKQLNQIFTSKLNPTPVFSYGSLQVALEFQYRYV